MNAEVQTLKEKQAVLDKEISQLIAGDYSMGELEDRISLLHEYSDIKDATQVLLKEAGFDPRGDHQGAIHPDADLDLNG